jgi:hypothetical protein
MTTRQIVWVAASALLAALLAGAYGIIEMNNAAMAGAANGKPAAFYGH